MWISVHVFICHLYIFFGEVHVQFFGLFKKLGCWLTYYWVLRVLYILWMPVDGLSFHSLNSVFCRAKVFNSMKSEGVSCSVMSDSLWPHGLEPSRLFCPWDFPGEKTGVGFHFLLQGIFPTQGLDPGLPHCRQTFYCLSHQGSPVYSINSIFLRIFCDPRVQKFSHIFWI